MKAMHAVLLALVGVGLSGVARADDAELDPTFAPGSPLGVGRTARPFDVASPFTDIAVKVLQQPSGRYVVVGMASIAGGATHGIAITRYLQNGLVDATFAGGGQRVKDACFQFVRNATLDGLGRIVVVGDVAPACTGNTTSDAGVVRFTVDGADDPSFAGDGGIGFKFRPDFDGVDWAGAVIALPDNSLIVGGSVQTTSTRQAVMQKVSEAGVVAATPAVFALVPAADTTFVDVVLSPSGTTTWLSQRLSNNTASIGALKRVFNGNLADDTSFGASGEQFLDASPSVGYAACGGAHYARALVRFGTTVKVFGYSTTSPFQRSWFASVRESNGGVRSYGCLDLGASPVGFAALGAVGSSDAGGSIYLAGQCGDPLKMCLWRTVKNDGSVDLFVPDPTFSFGTPSPATFTGSPSQPLPTSIGQSIIRDGDKSVVVGARQYLGADYDFALARFGTTAAVDALFSNGFE